MVGLPHLFNGSLFTDGHSHVYKEDSTNNDIIFFFGLKALPNFYKEEEDICDGGSIGSGFLDWFHSSKEPRRTTSERESERRFFLYIILGRVVPFLILLSSSKKVHDDTQHKVLSLSLDPTICLSALLTFPLCAHLAIS